MDVRKDDRSLGELFAELSREVSTLVRQEVDLARTEMTDKATKASRNVAFLVGGGVLGFAGLLFLLTAVMYLLATIGVPLWLSALIVGAVVAAIAAYLVQRGRTGLQNEDLTPKRTIRSLKEDAELAKEHTP